jgi:hypothetical protein
LYLNQSTHDRLSQNTESIFAMLIKTIKHNSIQIGLNVDGRDFDANNETWIIKPHIIVSSQTGYGVFDNSFVNNTVINHGRISSATLDAVFLEEGNEKVVNAVDGKMIGGSNGVTLNGSGNNALVNFGKIIGQGNAGVAFFIATHGVSLDNYGSISGPHFGVLDESSFTGGTIDNFGRISSGGNPIEINTAANLVTHIINGAGAVIEAPPLTDEGITLTHGSAHLVNFGTIQGGFYDLGGGNDVIVNRGHITGLVDLGTGNCTFNGTGGTVGLGISAEGGNDRIIVGNLGTSVEMGGNDTVTGASGGNNLYYFDYTPAIVDRITNFSPKLDHIALNSTYFPGMAGGPNFVLAAADFVVGTQATTSSEHIIYNPTNGFLYYDPDGSGPQAEIHFATLSRHLHMTHHDFYV